MRPITDYIRTLLYEHDYVTVPNFGAFIANYLPSSFNEVSGSLMPPQKKIAFNEILKQDDGLLATHISRKESLTIDEAKKKIQSFVSDVKETLSINKNYVFDKVGNFILNEENNLVFEPDRKNNFYSESFGFDSLFPRHITREKYVYSKTFEDDEDDLIISKHAYSSTIVRKNKGWTYALYALPVLLLTTGLLAVLFSEPNKQDGAKSSFNPLDYLPQTEVASPSDSQKNTSEFDIIKPNFEEKVVVPAEKLEAITIEKAEPPKVETAKKVEALAPKKVEIISKKSEPAKAETIINSEGKRYLVVSGMFRSLDNVEKLQVNLRNNGFSPKVVQIGDLMKVIAAETSSYAEAVSLAEKHKKVIGEKPAILKEN